MCQSVLQPDIVTNKVAPSLQQASVPSQQVCCCVPSGMVCSQAPARMQVEFSLLGILPGHVGLRGRLEAVGDGRDTVQVCAYTANHLHASSPAMARCSPSSLLCLLAGHALASRERSATKSQHKVEGLYVDIALQIVYTHCPGRWILTGRSWCCPGWACASGPGPPWC